MPSFPARRSPSLTGASKQRILVLQSNVPGRLLVWVVDGQGRVLASEQKIVEWHGSEFLLATVDRLLCRYRLTPAALQQIIVVRGPGSFTAVRTGLILANTLGYLLKIGVAGVVTAKPLSRQKIRQIVTSIIGKAKTGTFVRPWYGRQPNITRAAAVKK